MKKTIICSIVLLCLFNTSCIKEKPDPNIDLEAHEIVFSVVKTAPFSGNATIKGVIQNVGDDYRSDPGKQVIYLYEKELGVANGEIVAQKEFTNLDAGETLELSYSRSWSAPIEFPPDYILWISYGPDITMDGNEANDDKISVNNKLVKSGEGINDLF